MRGNRCIEEDTGHSAYIAVRRCAKGRTMSINSSSYDGEGEGEKAPGKDEVKGVRESGMELKKATVLGWE